METTEITDRQLEIIEAAGKALTEAGIGGLTIKNLAKEMKFSEAAIYRHFTSKEEIIVAMLKYLTQRLDERYSSLPKEVAPDQRLVSLFHEQFSFFKQHPHFVVAVFSDGLMEESKRINDTIAAIMTVKSKHLAPIIREGQLKGVFTGAVSAEALAHIVMGAVRLQMFKWRINNFQSDIRKSGDQLIQSLLTLIKAK